MGGWTEVKGRMRARPGLSTVLGGEGRLRMKSRGPALGLRAQVLPPAGSAPWTSDCTSLAAPLCLHHGPHNNSLFPSCHVSLLLLL